MSPDIDHIREDLKDPKFLEKFRYNTVSPEGGLYTGHVFSVCVDERARRKDQGGSYMNLPGGGIRF